MTRLKARIAEQIEALGPIPVNEYMALCLFDPAQVHPGYAAQWQTEMEALLAAGQPFTVAYVELDPVEPHADRKQRGLWLKHNKARLGRLCKAQISVEPDAGRRRMVEQAGSRSNGRRQPRLRRSQVEEAAQCRDVEANGPIAVGQDCQRQGAGAENAPVLLGERCDVQ